MTEYANASQYCGVLLKRPIGHASKNWQKRFFVIKDGFLLYYEEAEKKVFEKKKYVGLHPKGVMPLGDCSIAAVEEFGQPFSISVRNRASEEILFIAAETPAEQSDWMDMLTRSTRITWKNAQLGDAVIKQLQIYGSKLVEERQHIYEKLHMEVQSLSEEKQRTEELERINQELEAERCKMEAMSLELSEEYAKIKGELQTTAGVLAPIEREKEALGAASLVLEQQLQTLAQAKEEAERVLPSCPRSPSPASDVLLGASAPAATRDADQDSRLRAIEDEMRRLLGEKAEAEQRVLEKEKLTRLLEEEKLMYSQEAKRLQNNLEAIAHEKTSAQSELREQIRIRLAAEDRLQAAEQAVHDLAQRLGICSSADAPRSPANKRAGSESSIITAEQKEEMRSSVKSLKVYFSHVIAEQAIEASRPIIMRNSVSIRRLGIRTKSVSIAPTHGNRPEAVLLSPVPSVPAAAQGDPDSTAELLRATKVLQRDPSLRQMAIDVMTLPDCSSPCGASSSDCPDSLV